MALIHCPECGKEISDECKVCVHCGCKRKRGKRKKSVMITIAVLVVVIMTLVVLYIMNKSSSRYEQIFEIIESNQSEEVKSVLGNNYEKRSDEMSSWEAYKEIEIDGLECPNLVLHYNAKNFSDYKGTLFDLNHVSVQIKNDIIDNFIARYGKDYKLTQDKSGLKGTTYYWNNEGDRDISIEFLEPEGDDAYYIHILSFLKK